MNKIVITIVFALCSFLLHKAVLAFTISPLIMDFKAKPGESVSDSIFLFNETQVPISLILSIENFVPGDNSGEVNFELPVSKEQKDFLKWFFVRNEAVILQPKESAEIPFSIGIPKDAQGGTYYAALIWQRAPQVEDGREKVTSRIRLAERVSTLIFLNVENKKDILVNAELISFAVERGMRRLYSSVPSTFVAEVKNTGNIYIQPKGAIRITSMLRDNKALLTFNNTGLRIVSESSRVFITKWEKPPGPFVMLFNFWPGLRQELEYFGFGKYTVELLVDVEGMDNGALKKSVLFWVVPVRALIIMFVLLIMLLGVWKLWRRRKIMEIDRNILK